MPMTLGRTGRGLAVFCALALLGAALRAQASDNSASLDLYVFNQEDHGGSDYGHEFDASVSYPLWKGVTGLLKVADYRSDGFASDTRKLWFSLDYRL